LIPATAPDDPLSFQLLTAPAGMTVDPLSGLVLWQPTDADLGGHPITLRITTERGASLDHSFTLTVTPDTHAPSVSVRVSQNITAIGVPVPITVQASDDVAVASLTLKVNGTALTLAADGTAVYTPTESALLRVVATATDPRGNTGTDSTTVRVIDPSDTEGPAVTITSP